MTDEQHVEEIAANFVPVVRAEGDVNLRESGALAVVAGGNASMKEAGCGMLVAGGDVTISEAGGGNMIVGGSLSVSNGAVGNVFAGGGVSVADSRIVALLTPQASLENSEVILGTQQAVALGVAAGATLFVLGRLFRRG